MVSQGSQVAERATTTEIDHELIRRVGAGDHTAFHALVERYRSPLYAFILRMVGRPQVAEEIVQEAFVRAFRAAPRYRPDAPVSTWLFQIAHRLSMNEAAKAHHFHEVAGEAPDRPSEAPGPLEEVERRQLSRTIEEALGQLPPEQRAAVLLARFEDMSYREIGLVLGVSDGAVDGLLQRARRSLAKRLGPLL
jgi:RNA polymerase sigma-70 factor, ECF subfamily